MVLVVCIGGSLPPLAKAHTVTRLLLYIIAAWPSLPDVHLLRRFLVGLAIAVQVGLPLVGGTSLLAQGNAQPGFALLLLAGVLVSGFGGTYLTQGHVLMVCTHCSRLLGYWRVLGLLLLPAGVLVSA